MSLCRRFLFVAFLIPLVGRANAQDAPLDVLVKHLQSKNKAHRLEALKQLGRLGTAAKEAAPAIGQALRDAEDVDEVSRATATLAMIGPAGVPELTPLFKDARVAHARHAAAALAKMGPAGKKAAPYLVAVLKDRDPVVRGFAAQALGEIGDFSEEVIFALFGMIVDPVPQVRQQAAQAILRAGPKAVPGLKEIMSQGEGVVRVEAANLLGMLGTDGLGAKSDLISGLGDPMPELRAASAIALSQMGRQAKEALPELLQGLVKEKIPPVQQACFQAILQIGTQDMPDLLDQLRKINREANWAGPFVLAHLGPRPVDAVKPLIQSLGDKDPGIRMGAALALGRIGREATGAIPKLQMLTRDSHPGVRGAAAQALWDLDPRYEDMALNQLKAAYNQFGQAFRKSAATLDVALLKTPGNPFVRKSFLDPSLQLPLRQAMELHIMHNSIKMGKLRSAVGDLSRIDQLSQGVIDAAGPAAIPVLVDGLNKASAFRLGFC